MAQPRYQVIERIDAGGMAEVFKAESTSMQGFQKLVAIKRVLPSLTRNERFVRMFLDEAKVSLHLNHTNCVQVFDLGIADGTYFIVMEYIHGTDLKKVLEQLARDDAQMPVEQAVYMAIEICKGLSHAHNKLDRDGNPLQIVHRDISPPNVLLSREGEVKITDFGLAKAQSQVETTDPGVVKGKFGYLSPEAAHGELVDLRTDVFAVGILLWEMLIGKRLFLGKTDYETLTLVQQARIPSLQERRADVPHQLATIVERALAGDLNYRYQDCQSLASDLANFLYSWGRPVTGYDIATLVQGVLAVRSGEAQRVDDSRINEAVQREINQLKGLEEIENLDLYLASTFTSTSSYDDLPSPHHASLEDPASWAIDLDIEGDSEVDAEAFLKAAGGSNTWAKADISQLMQAERAPERPAADDEQPTQMMSRDEVLASIEREAHLDDDAPDLPVELAATPRHATPRHDALASDDLAHASSSSPSTSASAPFTSTSQFPTLASANSPQALAAVEEEPGSSKLLIVVIFLALLIGLGALALAFSML